jgi:predicted DNA-binding transcriptional regulator AlpA
MHKPSESVYLQPSLVLAARQVNVYDAMNLVAYAKVPLIPSLRAAELIAGFIERKNDAVSGAFVSPDQKDRLLEKYAADLARFRHPIAPADYTMLQEKMLDAGEAAIPYFFHEHHELVHSRRRASAMAKIHGRLGELVLSGKLILQISDTELAGFPIPSSAWMSRKSLDLYIEGEGVAPWWELRQNLDSHRRLIRIVMSDWLNLSNHGEPESIDEELLPSYVHARMLLKRVRPSGYPSRACAATSVPTPVQRPPSEVPGHLDASTNRVERDFDSGTQLTPDMSFDARESSAPIPPRTTAKQVMPKPPQDSPATIARRARSTTRDPEGDQLAEPDLPDPETALNRKQVAKLLGMSPGWVDNRRKDTPDFPKPYDFGTNNIKWERAEVLEWKRKHPRK